MSRNKKHKCSPNKKNFQKIKKEITFKDDSEGSGDEVYKNNYTLEDFVKMDFTDEADLFRHFFRCLKKTRHLLKLTKQLSQANGKTIEELFDIKKNEPVNEAAFEPVALVGGPNPNLINASKKIRLKTSKKNGERCLVATENLNFGEVLIAEKAVIMTDLLNSNTEHFTTYRCHHCLRFIGLFVTCPTCDVVTFCSYNCRYISWNEYHRWECFGLQRRFWNTPSLEYIALRMMFYGSQNGFNFGTKEFQDDFEVDEKHYGDEKNPYKYVYKLKTNTRELPRKELSEILLKCSELLVYLIEDTDFFPWLYKFPEYSTKRLYDVYMIVGGILVRHYVQATLHTIYVDQLNGHDGLYTEKYDFESGAIFITTSLLKQHCKPNTIHSFRENNIIVKALREIKAGEKITFGRYRPNSPKVMCHCEHCIAEKTKHFECNSLLCYKCQGNIIPVDIMKIPNILLFHSFVLKQLEADVGTLYCNGCNEIHDINVFRYVDKFGQKCVSAYEKSEQIEQLESALAVYKLILNPNHLFFGNFYEAIVRFRLPRGPKNFSLVLPRISSHLSILETHFGKYSYTLLSMMTKYTFRLIDYCRSFKAYPEDVVAFCDKLFKKVQKIAKFYYLEHILENYKMIWNNIKSNLKNAKLEKNN